jgi:large subunit ribosomal protein L20
MRDAPSAAALVFFFVAPSVCFYLHANSNMTRVGRGFVLRRKHNKILRQTRGNRGATSKIFAQANQQHMRALAASFASRKKKKTTNRGLWIQRIGSQVTYSRFIHFLKTAVMAVNRKMLAQFTVFDHRGFFSLYTFLGNVI